MKIVVPKHLPPPVDHKAAARVSLATLTKDLRQAFDMAKRQKRPATMITATMAIAKLHGLEVTQSVVDHRVSLDFSGAADALFGALASRAGVTAPMVESPDAGVVEGEQGGARIAPGHKREGVGVGGKAGKNKEVASPPLRQKRNPVTRVKVVSPKPG